MRKIRFPSKDMLFLKMKHRLMIFPLTVAKVTHSYSSSRRSGSSIGAGSQLFGTVLTIITLGSIGYLLWGFIHWLWNRHSHRRMTDIEREFAEEAYQLKSKALNAKKASKVDAALSVYEGLHYIAKKQGELVSEHIYQEDMRDMSDYYEDLTREEWEKSANKLLDKFRELYLIIAEPTYKDVERAYRSKKRCIEYWQKYFASMPTGIHVYPKQYLREYLDLDYDPCMESHELLEKRLSECIEQMKPEYQRVVRLRKDMLDYVFENDSVMRSELLRKQFDGCTDKEVEYCYRELVNKYKLVAVKIGNRYFVKLSDKEREKRSGAAKEKL